jgi:hypothetical protein
LGNIVRARTKKGREKGGREGGHEGRKEGRKEVREKERKNKGVCLKLIPNFVYANQLKLRVKTLLPRILIYFVFPMINEKFLLNF